MTEQLKNAIQAVRKNNSSFWKFISANDAGETGGHQAGLYMPKNAIKFMFDVPGKKGENKEKFANITWFDGIVSQCRFIYYGQGSRNEYRMTRLGRLFTEGQLVVISKISEELYHGFLFSEENEKKLFMGEFGLSTKNSNSVIDVKENLNLFLQQPLIEPPKYNIALSENIENKEVFFRPKAHILTLLGEELIRNPVMAIYELIKNSYDADAKNVDVIFHDISDLKKAKISVKDSGTGITAETLEDVWLEPGTAHRKPAGKDGKRTIVRSPIYNRVPMGEKGVGRFAVHKLGNKITLISRPSKLTVDENKRFKEKELLDYEIHLEIDWKSFTQSKYLEDVKISWTKNTDESTFLFKEDSGTYIEISGLKEQWTRGMARQLKRHTLSMVSPKNDPEKFTINLNFNNNWLDKFPDINEILAVAPYKLTAHVGKDYDLTFEYEFKLAGNQEIGSRVILNDKNFDQLIRGEIRPYFRSYFAHKGFEKEKLEEKIAELEKKPLPFGGVMMELYSYDLDSQSLKDVTYTPDILRSVLKDQHGVKVFKDDLRVYDYGEAGDDWLGLDIKRVNNKEWFSNNQNIGFVYLDSETSASLIEKTNREGFIDNESLDYFMVVLDFLLNLFKVERQKDRLKWLAFGAKERKGSFNEKITGFVSMINEAEIPDETKKRRLLEEANKLEDEYEKTKENLLLPAGVGLTASVALHEIEKLVPRMEDTVGRQPIPEKIIKDQVSELSEYIDGILSVLKRADSKAVDVADAIKQALSNYRLKLELRNITAEVIVDPEVSTIKCDKRYLVTMLMNLIDNSVYWLDTVYKEFKRILIKASVKNGVTQISVADNGPGFRDQAEDIVRPFFSRKEGGIGIGMYLIDTLMMKYGKLRIYGKDEDNDVGGPYDGAVVTLIFNKNQT